MWDTFSTPEAGIVEQVHSNIQKQLGKKVGTKNVNMYYSPYSILIHMFVMQVFIFECNRVHNTYLPVTMQAKTEHIKVRSQRTMGSKFFSTQFISSIFLKHLSF